jgi:hypothetical protein
LDHYQKTKSFAPAKKPNATKNIAHASLQEYSADFHVVVKIASTVKDTSKSN